MIKRVLRVLLGAALIFAIIPGSRALAQCGPGDHWVDACTGGQDTFTSVSASGSIDITLDCQTDITLPGNGSAVILRDDPSDDSQNYPGTRPTDGHLDVIDTEILSLSLVGTGVTIVAGAGQGQGGVLSASNGVIAEETTDPALAESFFDCYFEAYINGQYVYNHVPIRLQASIDRFPPYNQTYSFTGCVPAYTSPDSGQGTMVGNITGINLTIMEAESIPTLSEWGLLIMGLLLLLTGTVAVIRRRKAEARGISG